MSCGLSDRVLQPGLPGASFGGESGDLLAQQVDALSELPNATAHCVHIRQVVRSFAIKQTLTHL